jgi:flagellar hook assembly protein FlgD
MYNGILNIPVSSNDGLSESVNGFTTGNTLKLKIYTNGKESLLDFKTLDQTSDQFVAGASVIVKASVGTVTGMDDFISNTAISCYPNPFAEELTIEINQPAGIKLHVEIFDVMGRKISDLYQGISTGYDLIKWDGNNGQGANVRPGVYYIRCNDQVSKGIIKK